MALTMATERKQKMRSSMFVDSNICYKNPNQLPTVRPAYFIKLNLQTFIQS